MPVVLQVTAWFFELGGTITVPVYTDKITQAPGGYCNYTRITEDGLRQSFSVVEGYIHIVQTRADELLRLGYYVVEERDALSQASRLVGDAEERLSRGEYLECWATLRDARSGAERVHMDLLRMELVSTTGAVYLPSFLALYSVILAFFLFENDRKKLVSSVAFYLVFSLILFLIYPGSRRLASQNLSLFFEAGSLSIAATVALIFGLPILWRGTGLEGQFAVKTALPTMFSMAKRQIRRRKMRGALTITSVVVLVLAFTSLTSFGTVYGVASRTVGTAAPRAEGVLVKRTGTEVVGGFKFTPLVIGDIDSLPRQGFTLEYLAPKLENIPSPKRIAWLISELNKTVDIYGVLGIAPTNETYFTRLNDTVHEDKGEYLSDEDEDAVLISVEAAEKLDVRPGDTIRMDLDGFPRFANLTVRGLFDDAEYAQIVDLDGQKGLVREEEKAPPKEMEQPFGPRMIVSVDGETRVVACNGTNIVIMNWQTATRLQGRADDEAEARGIKAPTFAALSRISFRPADWSKLDDLTRMLVFRLEYDTFVYREGRVTVYFPGYTQIRLGAIELLFPLVIVCLNVGAVMLNAVYERRREMQLLSVVGSNPAHMAMVFVTEAIVLGMVGGGIGYLLGLGFYRVIALFPWLPPLMVREKLEWWWSAIGFLLAITASVLSAARPAMLAVRMYTPSAVRRVRLPEEEKKVRRREIQRVYQARRLSMPVKVNASEAAFFFSYLTDRLRDLSTGIHDRTEAIEEFPETRSPKGTIEKKIRFDHAYVSAGQTIRIKNEITCTKDPDEDFYRVQLTANPEEPGTPEDWIYQNAEFIRSVTADWNRDRKRILGID